MKLIYRLLGILITALIIAFSPSCNDKEKKGLPPPTDEQVSLLGVVLDTNGIIYPTEILQKINIVPRYDSILGDYKMKYDSLYGVIKILYKDSAGKKIPYQKLQQYSKDSINLHVEGIPLKILLDKSKWKQQK